MEHIQNTYVAIYESLKNFPNNPKEWVVLKTTIHDFESKIDECQKSKYIIDSFLELLSE